MDTKWNNTDSAANPVTGFIPEQVQSAEAQAGPRRTGRTAKAAAGFLAFFLGVSLVLGSLGAAAGRLAWRRGSSEWQQTDWQETAAFREQVSSYLREFLTLAAGEDLEWYNDWYGTETWEGTLTVTDWGTASTSVTEDTPRTDDSDPDDWYQNDKNVLYRICKQGGVSDGWYKNTEKAFTSYNTLPEGYNFLLIFQDGKVAIWKDGRELDVYGDGVYTEDCGWFVPGYENFPAGDNVSEARVYMAVRETPIQYYNTNYGIRESAMYWVYQRLEETRSFWLTQAALLGAGLLCLAVWSLLRREKQQADRKIATWTVHVWTEVRFLAVALALVCLVLPGAESAAREIWWVVWYSDAFPHALPYIGNALLACLENTGALLCLVWILWLIHNDHRYNSRERRRSLFRTAFRALRMKDLERPVQKRLARNSMAGLAAMVILLLCLIPVVWRAALLLLEGYYRPFWNIFTAVFFLVCAVLLACLIVSAWHGRRLARDVGLLAGQVEAIRGGDLSTPLELPEDADLRQTAEALNDIQAGLHKALEEQTRSERMKVELVSNVSHDLKTPLTSILSYAELLRQEPLEGAAADYARIIDEKAHRLSAMVQDVFEVSKAAASQLPVHLERLDLAKLLRQTLADMDDPIRASQLTFRIDLPEEPVMITADGKRLYRVFQNLIQNALQYALEGSRVYLSLKTGEGRAEASLRNTSRSELPEGVDFTARFVRGDESRTDGGSGLGLSIASSFTEACGGEFRVETVADLFTAVVSFPLAGA